MTDLQEIELMQMVNFGDLRDLVARHKVPGETWKFQFQIGHTTGAVEGELQSLELREPTGEESWIWTIWLTVTNTHGRFSPGNIVGIANEGQGRFLVLNQFKEMCGVANPA